MTGPDDWHPNVDNNAFTNVMASLAIHWARYSACMCSRNERDEVPDEWIQKALHLHLPFDNVKRLHYQYEGFETSMYLHDNIDRNIIITLSTLLKVLCVPQNDSTLESTVAIGKELRHLQYKSIISLALLNTNV